MKISKKEAEQREHEKRLALMHMQEKEIFICEDDFYDLLEDEIMNCSVFLDDTTESDFTETELYAYLVLLNNLQQFIDNHKKTIIVKSA